MTHRSTDRLYVALGPAITSQDPAGLLLSLLDGPGSQLGEVDDVVRDSDIPGWAAELLPDRASRPAWTAQFVGVQVPDSLSDSAARALIKDRPAHRRGGPAAMIAAGAATLTGTRYVNLIERDGSPYHLRVQTFTEETPDPAATEAAVRAQKPAALTLTFETVTSSSFAALEAQSSQTYTVLEGQSSQTYTALES